MGFIAICYKLEYNNKLENGFYKVSLHLSIVYTSFSDSGTKPLPGILKDPNSAQDEIDGSVMDTYSAGTVAQAQFSDSQ